MGDSSTGGLIDDLLRPTYHSGVLQRSSRKNYVMHPIFNVGRLFQRLTLDLHDYQLFGHT